MRHVQLTNKKNTWNIMQKSEWIWSCQLKSSWITQIHWGSPLAAHAVQSLRNFLSDSCLRQALYAGLCQGEPSPSHLTVEHHERLTSCQDFTCFIQSDVQSCIYFQIVSGSVIQRLTVLNLLGFCSVMSDGFFLLNYSRFVQLREYAESIFECISETRDKKCLLYKT